MYELLHNPRVIYPQKYFMQSPACTSIYINMYHSAKHVLSFTLHFTYADCVFIYICIAGFIECILKVHFPSLLFMYLKIDLRHLSIDQIISTKSLQFILFLLLFLLILIIHFLHLTIYLYIYCTLSDPNH
ncbi:hypothetical protein GDO81_015077 [Engystomops pustulosus]|uniref:Uncharacterized protein n=1 Tax=Engystomops pustulosus TaxID=76066 RepID=A0AAV7AGM8_ENGPU|nr:hypothetical protein GDO81_015077 [Engystomops pustulosus]